MANLPYFVASRKTTLQAPVTAAETGSITLKNLVDIYGNALAMSDFGSIIYLTINPGNNNAEFISATDFTVNSDGTVTIDTGITRGLAAKSPYASGGTARDHATGTTVVVSNAPQLYDLIMDYLVHIEGAQTVAGKKTFSTVPATSAGNPVDDTDLARKAYVDAVVAGSYPANRIVITGTAGATITAGDLIYLDTSDGEWKLSDADTASTVENVLLGIAQGSGVDGGAIASGVLIRGYDNNQTGLTGNKVLYASNTAGAVVEDTPGTTEVTVGFSLSATEIYFGPGFNQHITEDQQDALVGTSGTPSSANKFVTDDDTEGTGPVLRSSDVHIAGEFGGDGSDGALNISSGTTTIDVGGASLYVLNYTSISITGTASLAFSNPHASGTVVILKSMGDVTITSSAGAAIDMTGMGAASATNANFILDDLSHAGGNSAGDIIDPTTAVGGEQYTNRFLYLVPNGIFRHGYFIAPGSGGGAGSASSGSYSGYPAGRGAGCYGGIGGYGQRGSNNGQAGQGAGAGGGGGGSSSSGGTSGTGGRGAGGLLVECRGSLNFTGTILASGSTGGNGTNASAGGGGAAGIVALLYKILTANTGTITNAGGAGGNATGTGGAGGASIGGLIAEYR